MTERELNKSRVLQQVSSSLLFLFFLFAQGKEWMIPAFAAWLLHEAAHFGMGKALGYPLRLFTPGAVLLMSQSCQGWRQAALAAAGPGCNLLLAFLLPGQWGFCHLVMAVGNLLPVLPLDGGRICRSLLSFAVGWLPATRMLAFLGILVGGLLLCYGAYMRVAIAYLGFFLLFLAARELRYSRYQFWQALLAHRCKDGWRKKIFLPGDTSVGEAMGKLYPGCYCLIITGDGCLSGETVVNTFLTGQNNLAISFLPKQDLA